VHGWWWPGRQVVVVLPAAVLAVCLWACRSAKRLWLSAALGAAGVFNLGWLFAEGRRGQLTMVVDFFDTTNPLYRAWSRLLPDYIGLSTGDWVLHAIWVAVAFALALGTGWRLGARGLLQKFRRPRTT
jgi:hypothetical protein